MLERMLRKGNPSALLVGMQTGETTVENKLFWDCLWTVTQLMPNWHIIVYVFIMCRNYSLLLLSSHVCILTFSSMYMRFPQAVTWDSNRVQPRRRPHIGICNGVQNSRCSGNIRKIYIGCPHPHKPEPGEGTHGTGPFRAVLGSKSFAANPWHSHLTYL